MVENLLIFSFHSNDLKMVLNLSYLNNILKCCHEFEIVINVTAGCATSTTFSSWPLSFKLHP